MRLKILAVAIAAAFAWPGTVWCAKAPADPPVEPSARAPAADTAFRNLDANKDGFVTRSEAGKSGDLSKRFNEFDQNRDGKLSLQEFGAWRPVAADTTASNAKRNVAARVHSSDSRPPASRPRNPVDRSAADPGAGTFKALDLNNDGYLSRDEAHASGELSRRFTALDKNGDGKLSMPEVTGWRNTRESAGPNLARASGARP